MYAFAYAKVCRRVSRKKLDLKTLIIESGVGEIVTTLNHYICTATVLL